MCPVSTLKKTCDFTLILPPLWDIMRPWTGTAHLCENMPSPGCRAAARESGRSAGLPGVRGHRVLRAKQPSGFLPERSANSSVRSFRQEARAGTSRFQVCLAKLWVEDAGWET